MKIKIICTGSLKEKYWLSAEGEYLKRLSAYANVEINEIKENPLATGASKEVILKSKNEEGKRLLDKSYTGKSSKAPDASGSKIFRIGLDSKGKDLDSETFAKTFRMRAIEGRPETHFFIGGSNGLSSDVLDESDMVLSFGKKTFPHQLMRIILLEQIYRCFKINAGEPYHK